MSKKLNRTEEAIKLKASRLGLGCRFHSNPNLITFNKFMEAIGIRNGYRETEKIYIRNGFPIEYVKTEEKTFKMVNIKKFWKWGEENKNILNFSKFTKGMLGEEPEWVNIKRKHDLKDCSKRDHNREWTKKEDNMLISKVKSNRYTYAQLSEELGRTQGAIKRRLMDLKVPYRPIPMDNHDKWTKELTLKMVELYEQGATANVIASIIGKSQLSVHEKISAYKRGKLEDAYPVRPWDDKDTAYLKNQWNVLCTEEIAFNLKRSYFSVHKKAKRLGLGDNLKGKSKK